MKIYSNVLTEDSVKAATTYRQMAGVHTIKIDECKARKAKRRFDVLLAGTSNRNAYGSTIRAALWDEWGLFIAGLYEMDSDAIVGDYKDKGDFLLKTDWRFSDLQPEDICNHHWQYAGTPREQECSKCDTVRRL